MAVIALKNIATQIEMLSVADRIAAMELILQSLKKTEAQNRKTNWLDETFALMDKNSVSSSGKKWSRSDLYTRGM